MKKLGRAVSSTQAHMPTVNYRARNLAFDKRIHNLHCSSITLSEETAKCSPFVWRFRLWTLDFEPKLSRVPYTLPQ